MPDAAKGGLKRKLQAIALGTALLSLPGSNTLGAPSLAARLARNSDLMDVTQGHPGDAILVDLKYASTDNFMGKNVYGSLRRCYLRKKAAGMLSRAATTLRNLRPELRLLIYDCVRPLSVQRQMWDVVKGTPAQRYVANPKHLSMHNLGCAVDLTLASRSGKALDMGTHFDHASALSQPRLERRHLLKKRLSPEQVANRLLLRHVMVSAGFIPLAIEWWHFDCASRGAARRLGYRAIR